ncbi:unnamed protein product [Cuscuta epithymum]|uniref:Remorin C-terminal domain-containing protein n=1 Tax=Cuscuta epithymum TaxID=186058 RepID=A0AAV0FGL3_9ASTE|nr:unnamed protein product [Cuscuta epithymum]
MNMQARKETWENNVEITLRAAKAKHSSASSTGSGGREKSLRSTDVDQIRLAGHPPPPPPAPAYREQDLGGKSSEIAWPGLLGERPLPQRKSCEIADRKRTSPSAYRRERVVDRGLPAEQAQYPEQAEAVQEMEGQLGRKLPVRLSSASSSLVFSSPE